MRETRGRPGVKDRNPVPQILCFALREPGTEDCSRAIPKPGYPPMSTHSAERFIMSLHRYFLAGGSPRELLLCRSPAYLRAKTTSQLSPLNGARAVDVATIDLSPSLGPYRVVSSGDCRRCLSHLFYGFFGTISGEPLKE